MKVLKFPKDRVKQPRWRMWFRNANKRQILNKSLSSISLLVGLVIIIFIIRTLNKI